MYPVGAGHARPAAYRQIPFTINPQGRDSSLPGTLPPPQTATAARGLATLHPHIKPVRRAGGPHPAKTCRHIPFPHRRPVGAGHARPAAYRHIPFTIQSVGEGFIPPGHPSTGANGHGGQRAGRSTPHIKPVRRAGCPHPAETCRPPTCTICTFPQIYSFFCKKIYPKNFLCAIILSNSPLSGAATIQRRIIHAQPSSSCP